MTLKSDVKVEGKLTNLWFGKWHEKFGKLSSGHSSEQVSKSGIWWDAFIQSRKCMSSIFTRKLYVMTMKNDAKVEGELTFQFKTDMRKLTDFFDRSTQKPQKIAL